MQSAIRTRGQAAKLRIWERGRTVAWGACVKPKPFVSCSFSDNSFGPLAGHFLGTYAAALCPLALVLGTQLAPSTGLCSTKNCPWSDSRSIF